MIDPAIFQYLDRLKKSGTVNMLRAVPHVVHIFAVPQLVANYNVVMWTKEKIYAEL